MPQLSNTSNDLSVLFFVKCQSHRPLTVTYQLVNTMLLSNTFCDISQFGTVRKYNTACENNSTLVTSSDSCRPSKIFSIFIYVILFSIGQIFVSIQSVDLFAKYILFPAYNPVVWQTIRATGLYAIVHFIFIILAPVEVDLFSWWRSWWDTREFGFSPAPGSENEIKHAKIGRILYT